MPQGRKGHIGLAPETGFGTPVAAAAYFRFRSEGLPTSIEEVTPPNILGVFDEGPTYQGLKTHAGDIEFDAHPNILGWFLLSALGPVTTTKQDTGLATITVAATAKTYTRSAGSFVTNGFLAGDTVVVSGFTNAGNNGTKVIATVAALVLTMTVATGLVDEAGDADERVMGTRYTHTFAARQTDFSEACAVQPLTLEIHRDLGDAFQYAGCAVNALRLAFGVDAKVLSATAGVIAKTMARITATSPGFEATQAFRWNQAVITLPHPTGFATMDSLQVALDGGLEGKAFIDGTQEIARIRASRPRVIGVSGRMIGNDSELTAFIAGNERAMKCVFTGPALGGANFKLELEYPAFRYTAYPVRITGPDEIMVEFEGKAKYDPNVASTPMKAVLVNSQSAY